MRLRNDCTAARSSSRLLMCLKVLIFRGNALIYIKGPHIFQWPTFSPPRSLPQVHLSRAEELYRPLPARASQASGQAGPLREEPVDQGVEELQGRRAGQTLRAVHPALTHPGDACGHPPPVSHCLWHHGGWIHAECDHWELSEASTHMRKQRLICNLKDYLFWKCILNRLMTGYIPV